MQVPAIRKSVFLLMLGLGVLFVAFHIIVNASSWIRSSFTKIQHPTTYGFPTYDKLLHEVVRDNAVDYQLAKKSPLLAAAIEELAVVAPDKLNSEKAKLCYWLNSYNLLTLKLISDRYPIDSPKRLGNAVSLTKFTIGGDTFSVRDVMDYKLNPFFKRNPTLTFLVCEGTKGSPPLLNHALVPETVMSDADSSLTNFVNDPANYKYDEVANVFLISPYFQRYDDYFVAYYESAHFLAASKMKMNVPVAQMTLLKSYSRTFDSRLNDVQKTRATK